MRKLVIMIGLMTLASCSSVKETTVPNKDVQVKENTEIKEYYTIQFSDNRGFIILEKKN
jgi:hypothetical protein